MNYICKQLCEEFAQYFQVVYEGFGNGLLFYPPTELDPPDANGWYEEMASPASPVLAIPRELRPDEDYFTPDYKRQLFLWKKQQEFQLQKSRVTRRLDFETVATDGARAGLKQLKINSKVEMPDCRSKVQSEPGCSPVEK